ncbi:MAG: YicC/YloC family endoribonuclease, partial [Hyphomicrobiaceae bacterium]
MALRSMTGFARVDDSLGPVRWHWELRSVNGRGLDLRFRLPPGFDAIEPKLRELMAKRIVRGSLNVSLTVERDQSGVEIRLNEQALDQVARIAHRVAALTGSAPPSTDALLQIRGVLETIETVDDEETAARRTDAMLASLDRAVAALVTAREAEGLRLAEVLGTQVDQISEIVRRVEALPARRTEVVAERLRDSVARLAETSSAFDPARLHQEAV